MKKMRKLLVIAFILAILLSKFEISASASSNYYDSDWRYWSQGGTGIGDNMKKYGCYIVSQSKLLVESGIIEDKQNFNPDTLATWERENGYVDSSWRMTTNAAPAIYAKSVGKTLNYCGEINISKKSRIQQNTSIMEWLQDGYYIILSYTVPSSHYYYVSRADSINSGEVWLSDTQSTVANSSKAWSNDQTQNPGHYLLMKLADWRIKNGIETRNAQTAYLFSKTNTTLPASSNIDTNTSVSITVSTCPATEVTETSARLNSSLKITGGTGHITKHGMYLGTDPSRLTIIAEDKVEYNKSLLSMFYRTTKYGPTLKAGTTYYYQAYVVVDGMQHTGEVCTFTTLGSVGPESDPPVSPKISLSNTSMTMKADVCWELDVTTTPSGEKVTWRSSNTSVATVKNGKITGRNPGTTTITAEMTYEGKIYSATCEVTVTASEPPATPRLQLSSRSIFAGAEVTASWSKVTNATRYTIVITNSQTGRSEEKSTTDTRMVLSGLDVGTYQIQVFSENDSTRSDLSDPIQLVVAEKEVLPGKPVIRLSANTINAGEDITLSWDADAKATEFEVKYISGMTLNSDTTTRTSYTLTNLAAGTYRFTVTAINESGRVSSDTVTLTVDSQITLPKKPVVKLSSSTITEGGSVTVSWDSDVNTQWFFLHYGSSFQQLSDSYSTLANLAAGTYTIYVEANNQSGSTVSDTVTLTVTAPVATDPTATGYVLGTNGALAINSIAASGNQIGRIPEGSSCTIYTDRTSGNWYYVEYNGVKGYAFKSYITTTRPTTHTGIISGTNGALAINSTASTGNQIGRIPEGASCTVFTDRTNGNWYWVFYNGVAGYAYSKYITLQ